MPRMICFVCLLGCVGCAGAGKSARNNDESLHRVAAAEAAAGPIQVSSASLRVASDPVVAGDQQAESRVEPPALPAPDQEMLAEDGNRLTDLALNPANLQANAVALNLPTVLSMVDGQHPAVGLARWRVQQAYAKLDQSRVLWLPSIRAGFSFHKHDGNYQASDGTIVDVNRNSFQSGLGVGATGAGTTPNPGLVAQFHLADAIFQPKIADRSASARRHAANAVVNQQLLVAGSAYLDLLSAHQDVRIVEETRDRTSELYKLTSDFSTAGKGLRADADRMATELALVENRLVASRLRIDVTAANLAQAVSAPAGSQFFPMDPTIVPIELVSIELDKVALIRTGLSNRPELRESQALVAAACAESRRQRYSPFVPSVLLGFSTGSFGGGLGNNLENVDGRYDLDALVSWELRNLGLGERAARRDANALVQQARFEKLRVMDQVAREVSEAQSQVWHHTQQITITQQAVEFAEDSYRRNRNRIRDGQGLPLEVLQSLGALEDARRAYLNAIVDYNRAQFRLQWSLGWSITAPESFQ